MSTVYLAQGDCLRLMGGLAAASIDMVLCDPPYGITDCAWDRKLDVAGLWTEYARVVKPRGVIAMFAQQPFATELAAAAPRKSFRYEWIWDKSAATGFGNAKRMPMRRHENILIFYRQTPVYQPQGLRPAARKCRARTQQGEAYRAMKGGAYVQSYTGYPQSIIRFPREHRAAACQKPVDLLEYLIRTYTREGETVLDNTMGLGSAGVAAVRCGRSFIGMELDGARFRAAEVRITEAMRSHGACRRRSL